MHNVEKKPSHYKLYYGSVLLEDIVSESSVRIMVFVYTIRNFP